MSVTKPLMTLAWAFGGSVVKPNDAKIQEGWTAEKPPFQTENWIQNRTDLFLQHINVEGMPVWDSFTTYEIGSITKGSDTKVYTSNSNPNLGNDPTVPSGDWSENVGTGSEVINLIYPIGSIFMSVSNVDPSIQFGFGTWSKYAEGKVIVGQQDSDPIFDTSGNIGGDKDAVNVSHFHTMTSDGLHSHTFDVPEDSPPQNNEIDVSSLIGAGGIHQQISSSDGLHAHTISTAGTTGTDKNLQPYIVAHIWERTA